jgi:hypothetical protein
VVAKHLLEMQAELHCQDKEFDTLVKAMRDQQANLHQRLGKEANQVRLVLDSLDELGTINVPAWQTHREAVEPNAGNILSIWVNQAGALAPEADAPAVHDDMEGSHIMGEPGPELHLQMRYPQLGQ